MAEVDWKRIENFLECSFEKKTDFRPCFIIPPLACMKGALWAKRGKQSILRKVQDEGWEKNITFFLFSWSHGRCKMPFSDLLTWLLQVYGYCDIKILWLVDLAECT